MSDIASNLSVWERLKGMVGASETAGRPADVGHQMQIAAAVLLLEVQRADMDISDAERNAICVQLRNHFELSGVELETVMQTAGKRSDQSVSLHAFLQVLNENLQPPQKLEIMEMLWRVAYADNRLDKQEEALLRHMAELLHIPHHDFIRVKLKVLGEA